MNKEVASEVMASFRYIILEYSRGRNISKVCREFNIPRSTFYNWRKRYDEEGPSGLYRKKPVAHSHPRKTPPEVIEKILEIRREYQMGAWRIKYYLERYHGIKISESTVSRTLKAHGVGKLPKTASRRSIHTKRYAKTVPGHHVQVDVKFLKLKGAAGKSVIRRYQYTAIDDATRIRALQIYQKHNQNCAIKFIDYVIEKFPFRISMVRTDRGHEFQARFHFHVEDSGIQHAYIKPRSPQLNGKVERSHLTDQREFYQLLTYTDDVDLNSKLGAWESYYNYDRPHMSHDGRTPYEVMKSLLDK